MQSFCMKVNIGHIEQLVPLESFPTLGTEADCFFSSMNGTNAMFKHVASSSFPSFTIGILSVESTLPIEVKELQISNYR